MMYRLDKRSALIIVDVQRDFCPGGALPVPDGDKIVPVLNGYIELFKKAGSPIFATRDWHPKNHCSFKSRGGPWPEHCVQNTIGAEFHPELKLPRDVVVISKGTDADKEAYSGFEGTNLEAELKRRKVKRIFVGGLATDYCVKHTVIDGLKKGFEVVLLEDAIKGVDVKEGDSERAIKEMVKKGAKLAKITDISR